MRNYCKGMATPTAVIFTMVSMLITAGYLKYAMSASVSQKYRFEEAKALLMAETGINTEALPVLPKLVDQSVVLAADGVFLEGMGFYRNVVCSTYVSLEDGRTIFHARGSGISEFRNTLGKPVRIERMAEMNLVAEDFSKFMYFTNSEEPGGGPQLGSYVSFGGSDILEGVVHTNGQMTMSQFGCPDFTQADISAANGIILNNCNDQNWGSVDDSAEVRVYPPYDATERAKENANYVFTADDMLWRSTGKDTLIMTEIEFVIGGFTVSQWTYLMPPVGESGPPPTNFNWDVDTEIEQLGNESIAFDGPYDSTLQVYFTDTLFIDTEDIEGNDASNTLEMYEIGDTVLVRSADPDSNKGWIGVLNSTNQVGGIFVFGVQSLGQFFENGFSPGEEVTLAFQGGLDNSVPFNNFANYHNHLNDGSSVCQSSGFHHFDFEPTNNSPDILPPTTFFTDFAVIYVKGGQVRVRGTVDGKFSIVTDNFTEYRRHDDISIVDRVWGNIWLMDDILYEDSNSITGEIVYGTKNRLGLISGANIIIANTMENGGKNQANGSDIIINGALLAMNDSFVAHYWQNSISNNSLNGPEFSNPLNSKGDGRGPFRNPSSALPQVTGNSDIRGQMILWGSTTQNKRGYMKRNAPGPYPVSPGIGYDKDYHYDYNFSDFGPPPMYPTSSSSSGGAILIIKSYGEVDQLTLKEFSE